MKVYLPRACSWPTEKGLPTRVLAGRGVGTRGRTALGTVGRHTIWDFGRNWVPFQARSLCTVFGSPHPRLSANSLVKSEHVTPRSASTALYLNLFAYSFFTSLVLKVLE